MEIPFAKGITGTSRHHGQHSAAVGGDDGLQSSCLPEDYKVTFQGTQRIPQPLDWDALADAVAFLSSDAAGFMGHSLAKFLSRNISL